MERILFVVSFHPALNELKNTLGMLQNMLVASEKHWSAFKEQPLVAFRHAPNFKDNFVRAELPQLQRELVKGCFRCGKSRCQVCMFMVEGDSFRSEVSGGEFKISISFTCDSSEVVYLLGCKVCGLQYVESTFTQFRARFNNYKSACRRFFKGE